MKSTAIAIVESLKQAGHRAYFVGGCVRDLILKKDPKDYDIATSARPDEIEALFTETYAVGKAFGVITVKENNHHFEVATFRSDSTNSDGRRPDAVIFSHESDDALRRDFTINGLFYDPTTETIEDFVGGRSDLNAKIIRFIGDPKTRILEDHLRLLRAVRFRATLDFDYHIDTRTALEAHAELVANVSMERVRDELNKMLADPSAGTALHDLHALGFFKYLLPELREPELDFWRAIEDEKATADLRWAILFKELKDPFDAPAILRRFRMPGAQASLIEWILRHDILETELQTWTLGAQRRLFLHPNFPLLWEWWRMRCGNPEKLKEIQVEWTAIRDHFEEVPKPLLTGTEIIAITGQKAGPEIGRMQNELLHLQLEHRIKTRSEAETWVRGR